MAPLPAVAAALRRLRDRLVEAGYTQAAVRERLSIVHPDDIGLLNREPTLLKLRQDTSGLATALRLFFLEAEVGLVEARRLLSARGLEELTGLHVVTRQGNAVVARLRLDAVGEQVFLSDRRYRSPDRLGLRACLPLSRSRLDPVYPPSSDSILLREAADASGRMLDLCTGSGIQAVARAGEAREVVAVDINPRAAAIAACNAVMNDASNVEVRLGDLYAPVARERFDRILANPPFVTSPYANGPSYHAGGPTGDDLLRRILRGLGRYLAPGGRAFAISHVGLRRGQDLDAVASTWLRGFPGRGLVVQLDSGSEVDLAAAQALFALEKGAAAYAREVRRWVDYLGRHRIDRVVAVLVVAEKVGEPCVDVVDATPRVFPMPLTPSPTQRIQAWFAARGEAAACFRPPAT